MKVNNNHLLTKRSSTRYMPYLRCVFGKYVHWNILPSPVARYGNDQTICTLQPHSHSRTYNRQHAKTLFITSRKLYYICVSVSLIDIILFAFMYEERDRAWLSMHTAESFWQFHIRRTLHLCSVSVNQINIPYHPIVGTHWILLWISFTRSIRINWMGCHARKRCIVQCIRW